MNLLKFFSKLFKKEVKVEEKYVYIDHLQLLKPIRTNFNTYKELEMYLQLVLEANTRADMMEANNMFIISETSIKETTALDFFNSNDVYALLRKLKEYRMLLEEKLENEKDSYLIRMTKVGIKVVDDILSYF